MTEFLDWLEKNKERLTTYSPSEISDVAIACGFDRSVVAMWETKERFRKVI
jgi:hypothetical protein